MNLMTHPFSFTYFSCIIKLVARIFGMDKNCFLSFRKDLAKLKEMVKNKSSEEVGFVFSKLVILFIAISAHFSVCASERKQFILHHTWWFVWLRSAYYNNERSSYGKLQYNVKDKIHRETENASTDYHSLAYYASVCQWCQDLSKQTLFFGQFGEHQSMISQI